MTEQIPKNPIKELPKCFGDPEVECIYKCAIEPVCANTWLERHNRAEEERKLKSNVQFIVKEQKEVSKDA